MLRNKLRFGLIAFEVALTFAIVVNCVTMIHKARTDLAKTSGMADDDLVSVDVRPFDPSFKDDAHFDAVRERDLAALKAMPGVQAATESRLLPWQGGGSSTELKPVGSRAGFLRTQQYNADESTFATLGLTLSAGKGFTTEDVQRETHGLRALNASVRDRNPDGTAKQIYTLELIISKAFAKIAFGDEPPLGKLLEDRDGDQYRVVGVVESFYNPYAWNIGENVFFYPSRAQGNARYLVRAEPGRRAEVERAVEARLLAVDSGRNFQIRSIADLRTRFDANNVLVVRVLSLVLFLVVFVTFLGVVGVTSFSVAERTRQIGIRRAIGAQRSDVVVHFLTESGIVSALGLAVGVGLAYGLNIALVSHLGASRLEPASIAATLALLALSAQAAALVPALRASRVAPTIATRSV